MLLGLDGVLNGARCSQQLSWMVTTELLRVYWEIEKVREFLRPFGSRAEGR